MKEFHTLRGFLKGDESPDVVPDLASGATLRILSEEGLDFEEIEATLGLQPTQTGRRGERKGSRSPPSRHDIWMYRAAVPSEAELHEHIDALWGVLRPNAMYLKELKSHATVDVFLSYSSNIDHGGLVVPFGSLEMFTALEIDFGLSIVVLTDDA